MAKAPTRGAERAAESATQHVFRIRVRDKTVDAPTPAALPMKEKVAVRSGTGLPIEAFVKPGESTFGEDSLVVLWWLGRRAAGEPSLTFDDAVEQWPSDLDEDDLDLELVDLTAEEVDEHPEGSGPSS